MSITDDIKIVDQWRARLFANDDAAAKQKKENKLTARQRISALLDDGSFAELNALVNSGGEAAGVVTGYGIANGRPVCVISQDMTIRSGAVDAMHARKILAAVDMAQSTGTPLVIFCDSLGAAVEDNVSALSSNAEIISAVARLRGVVPIICVIAGQCAGTAAMLAGVADITLLAGNGGGAYTTAPQVLEAVTQTSVSIEDFNDSADIICDDEEQAINTVKKLLGMLPLNNKEMPPVEMSDDINRLVTGVNSEYQTSELFLQLADNGDAISLRTPNGSNMALALARMGGRTVGIIANTQNGGGALTAEGCGAAARFLRFLNYFTIPVITVCDSTGYEVVSADRQPQLIKNSAELASAYASAGSVKITLYTGAAYGAAYTVMCGKSACDIAYAWPGAVISALEPEAAVQILYSGELAGASNPIAKRAELLDRYKSQTAGSMAAASAGLADDIINPEETRKYIIWAVEMLLSKRAGVIYKKHDSLSL